MKAAFFAAVVLAMSPPPGALSALLAKAGTRGSPLAWCAGEFRPGQGDAYAAAVSSTAGTGRYLVIERDGRVFELSVFRGRPDLSCYTPAEARRLDAAIAGSETIHGKLAPRWSTTVICAFVEETNAVCWQFSPAEGRFVKVGEWIT